MEAFNWASIMPRDVSLCGSRSKIFQSGYEQNQSIFLRKKNIFLLKKNGLHLQEGVPDSASTADTHLWTGGGFHLCRPGEYLFFCWEVRSIFLFCFKVRLIFLFLFQSKVNISFLFQSKVNISFLVQSKVNIYFLFQSKVNIYFFSFKVSNFDKYIFLEEGQYQYFLSSFQKYRHRV